MQVGVEGWAMGVVEAAVVLYVQEHPRPTCKIHPLLRVHPEWGSYLSAGSSTELQCHILLRITWFDRVMTDALEPRACMQESSAAVKLQMQILRSADAQWVQGTRACVLWSAEGRGVCNSMQLPVMPAAPAQREFSGLIAFHLYMDHRAHRSWARCRRSPH